MMKRLALILLVIGLSLGLAVAQTEAGAKGTATGTSSTQASAGKSGAQVESSNSAATSQEVNASSEPAQNKQQKKDAKASASSSADASASAKAGGNSAKLSSGTVIDATLTKSVSANKNKQGDRVEAKTTQDVKSAGQTVIPRGSKLIGRVTKAQAREKGKAESQSELGIVFDRALLKDGREIPLDATIQAVAAAQSAASSSLMAEEPMVSGAGSTMSAAHASGQGRTANGGLLGGATSTVGSTVGAAAGTTGNLAGGVVNTAAHTTSEIGSSVGGTNSAAAELTSATTGVVGLDGLQLQSAGSSATQGSVIASPSKNVSLDSGTRLLLRVVGGN
ncbi:MAG TPA: hypothetical protein VLE48_15005 [Terriglobales bacterium]|nr:hypothetical protein [Terriglobales bacterium]